MVKQKRAMEGRKKERKKYKERKKKGTGEGRKKQTKRKWKIRQRNWTYIENRTKTMEKIENLMRKSVKIPIIERETIQKGRRK